MIRLALRFTGSTWAALLAVSASTAIAILIVFYTPISNTALLYLPAIMLCAVLFGTWSALVAAVLAIVEYDFFLVGPVYTFSPPELGDSVTFVIFGIVALLTSQLAGRAQARAETAQRRAAESTTLYELSQALMSVIDVDEVLNTITHRIVDVFAVDRCAIFVPTPAGDLRLAWEDTRTEQNRGRDEPALYRSFREGITVGLHDTICQPIYVPLRTADRTVGVMEVGLKRSGEALDPDEQRLVSSFGAQAALVIARTQMEEEQRQLKLLEESDQLKSALLSAVSHDLRTPLASIKASATSLLLSESTWTREEAREFLHTIDQQADRLNRLVGNLLDLSRIEAGALKPVLDWYDVHEVLDIIVPRLQPLLGGRVFSVRVSSPIPLIHIDLVRVEGLVTNLVENAVKYTPPQTPIELHIWSDQAGLHLAVIDHGRGIPADQRERIFDRFYRLQRHSDRDPGTGLGLAICQGVAEAHGGRILVEATPGGGATFILSLPPSLLASPVPV